MDRGSAGTPGSDSAGGDAVGLTPGEAAGADRLAVAVRSVAGSVVVAPSGELDHDTADLLRGPLERALDEGEDRIVVDCSDLLFCDSTGLNVLLAARLRAQEAGGAVHLAAMRPAVARVFEITGAETVFRVHGSLDEALADR
ncbi:STAS domain-containing protein [Streptacidiphilus sp. ASG 303]|uniref:STAS domain-containing protein n=1 Tax=Streptomycetaceae TaxID=2062 RepID=UPI001E4D8E1B|nr:STAS domain-containing protein [Streptacidiphilus sp. ASG 303]MCD0481809.1 STAS domain-containing protein [Streptacidiphilus sp. ASG 303]